MDLLATAHANRRGIYVWTNQAVYGDPGAIAPSDSPVRCHLPAVGPDGGDERPADTVGGSSDAADWSAGSSDDSSEEVTGEEDGGALGGVDKIDPATGECRQAKDTSQP